MLLCNFSARQSGRSLFRAAAESGEVVIEIISVDHLGCERGRQVIPNKRTHIRTCLGLALLRQGCLQSVLTLLKWSQREISPQRAVIIHKPCD